jgi:DNA-binding transcriptional MocR family regulator
VLLDPNAPERLYVQLAETLAGQIEDGTYGAGERIPSVRKLRDQFGVSLTTVLQACRVLEDRGLVQARAQSGHYVKAREPERRSEPEESRPSGEAKRVDASLAVRLNLGIGNPQEPTLGAAVQGPGLMPIAALNRLLGHVYRHQPAACHSYDAPPGSAVLRRSIAQRGGDAGYRVTADDIVITSGAKEAVYLSIKAVTKAGDTVAIESPAYYALLEVLASLELKALEISSHPRHGINLDDLGRALSSRPIAAVALVSNFSNPTGSCMTDAAKRALVALLDDHDVPLVEDDVYGELVYEGPRPSAIKAFDSRGLVLYCSSYSKTLSPGLRVGWCIPGRYQNQVELLKLVVNQATAVAPQLALAAFLDSGGCDRHIRRVRRMYRDQMASMIDAVERHFPESTRLTRPQGGHVLWVQLPGGVDAMDLYDAADAVGIRIAPGPMFSPSPGYRNFIRLNTGFPWNETTEQQMTTLGRLVAERVHPGQAA